MVDFSLKLHFRNSRSIRFNEVMGYAKRFDSFQKGEVNVIDVSLKELFEKWEFFNNAFLIVVDWKGTVLEFDNMRWHSHYDMKQLFYGLQQAQSACRNISKNKASELCEVYNEKRLFCELPMKFTEEDWNGYLDLINHLKELNNPNKNGK